MQTSLTDTLKQFEFLRQLSVNPANTVIGLVRDVKSTKAKVEAEIKRSNVHIIHGDLDSYDVLKVGHRRTSLGNIAKRRLQEASEATAKITGGGLDYLIASGARLPKESSFLTFGEM